ncbi:DUF2778 domain-containing protein [Burkholderia glumae]|uniref:DUF2778 domain-containing protein n=1 Tax=Burkholderia glumae TaxID=337 RepID=UPI000F5DDD47|nr:DUF2778 domain-containing protein [Burkholderia glumae]RQZ65528.1 DUF2778 domain-containing protein [Burkholderia glumae]
MPLAQCSFTLNGLRISSLICDGRIYPAFSGEKGHENKPSDTALVKIGPLPKGSYYIVDRQSGGRLGWLWDTAATLLNNSHRDNWFALYRNDGAIDDWTYVNGIKRGNFRLHPVGRAAISEGCITLTSPTQFDQLRTYLKSQAPQTIPGTTIKYYGTVEVK